MLNKYQLTVTLIADSEETLKRFYNYSNTINQDGVDVPNPVSLNTHIASIVSGKEQANLDQVIATDAALAARAAKITELNQAKDILNADQTAQPIEISTIAPADVAAEEIISK